MNLGPADFPENVLTALRDGSLVVFAGAGVSINPPANLPTFQGLAAQVASNTGRKQLKEEGPVEYFSRINGPENVHQEIADILTKANPLPNSLHKDILGLFVRQRQPRIVTTNFDLLFEAAKSGEAWYAYTAPALPPGDRFQGIVHLHGAITQPEEMVVTISDISRAYLMEGWALGFLKQMFSALTVLFVGYSHDDIMMQYLARGMPAQDEVLQRRFALTPEGAEVEAHWKNLGITPVTFPKGLKNRHEHLPWAMNSMAELISRGPGEWEQRIRAIAERPYTPTDPEEQDVIAAAFLDPQQKLGFFTDAAESPEWLGWVERNWSVGRLFQPGELDEVEGALAVWIAEEFTTQFPGELRQLIGRQGSHLNPVLWERMAFALANQQAPITGPDTTRKWIPLLLYTTPQGDNALTCGGLDYIAETCVREGLTESLVACFGEMCRMTMSVRGDDVELGTACPQWLLQKTWSTMKDNLDDVAEPVLDLAVRQIEQRHWTLAQWNSEGADIDMDSRRRAQIKISPEEADAQGIDSIIDAARDCLEWLSQRDPERVLQWCNRNVASQILLLIRLSTLTIGYIPTVCFDDGAKIDWLIENELLYHPHAKPEAQSVATAAMPNADAATQERLLEALKQQAEPPLELE